MIDRVEGLAFLWGILGDQLRGIAKRFDCLSSCGRFVLGHLLHDRIEAWGDKKRNATTPD